MLDNVVSRRKNAVRFSRVLRLSWVVAIGASASVGLGVYTLLEQVVNLSPLDSAWQPYLVMMVLATPILLTYAERAGVIPGSAGAYDLVRAGESLWLVYATGWILIGGYASLIAILGWSAAYHIGTFLQQFFDLALDIRWLASGVLVLVFLNNLRTRTVFWKSGVTFIFLSITFLLVIFLWAFFLPEPGTRNVPFVSRPESSFYIAALLVSSLWGLSFIISLRDEIQRPTRTILPAMILTLALGVGLGVLGALDFGHSLEATRSATISLSELTVELVLSGVTTVLYIAFGLGINLFALNRGFANGRRVLNALSRDGFLPDRLPVIGRSGTAVLPFLFITLVSILLGWLVPLLTIVSLASLTFLWTAALVHIPDLFRSAPSLPGKRSPRLPFHPLFPGLTVAIGLLVPFYLKAVVWWYVLGWVTLGTLYFLFYARRRGLAVHRQEVLVGELEVVEHQKFRYRVMVGLANPETATALIRAGANFARARDGSLRVLRVLTLADQVPDHLKQHAAQEEWRSLANLVEQVGVQGVTVVPLVRLASTPAEGILAAVSEEQVDLLLLGWGGELPSDDLRIDPVLTVIVRHAPCEVAILRGGLPQTIKRVAVPSGGGPYAPTALRLGEDLIEQDQGQVSLVHVVTGAMTPELETGFMANLQNMQSLARSRERIRPQVVQSGSVRDGILEEAGNADLLMIGASKGGLPERPYFGGLAVEVARESPSPTILVRGREKWRYPRLRYFLETLFDPFPTLTARRQASVIQGMIQAAVPSFDYFILIVLSSIIASMGLLQDSAAVIIGAMLVAPLMSPILAVAMSMVIADLRTLWTAAEATIKGVVLTIVVAIVMVLLSPLTEPTNQIMIRTEPNLLDLTVALASGAAAGYAVARKQLAAALPGVAIAAALVPPLVVVGYGIGASQMDIASGALLLFITNLVAIVFAAAIIFLTLGFHPTKPDRSELVRGLQITALTLLLVFAVLGYTTVLTVRQLSREQRLRTLFNQAVVSEFTQIESLEIVPDGKGFILSAKIINFEENQLTFEEITELEEALSQAAGGPIRIQATMVEASMMDLALSDWGRQLLLGRVFREKIEAYSARLVDLDVDFEGSYRIEAAVIVFEDSELDGEVLGDIQEELSVLVGAPVTIRATLLGGQQVELEALAPVTPIP